MNDRMTIRVSNGNVVDRDTLYRKKKEKKNTAFDEESND